jgi:hypothetical protein
MDFTEYLPLLIFIIVVVGWSWWRMKKEGV